MASILAIKDLTAKIQELVQKTGKDLYRDPVYQYLPQAMSVRLKGEGQVADTAFDVPTLCWLQLSPERFKSSLEQQMTEAFTNVVRSIHDDKRQRTDDAGSAAVSGERLQWQPLIEIAAAEVDGRALSVIAAMCRVQGGAALEPLLVSFAVTHLKAQEVAELLRAAAYLDSDILIQGINECLQWADMTADDIVSVMVPAALLKNAQTPALRELVKKLQPAGADSPPRRFLLFSPDTDPGARRRLIHAMLQLWPHPAATIIRSLLNARDSERTAFGVALLCGMAFEAHRPAPAPAGSAAAGGAASGAPSAASAGAPPVDVPAAAKGVPASAAEVAPHANTRQDKVVPGAAPAHAADADQDVVMQQEEGAAGDADKGGEVPRGGVTPPRCWGESSSAAEPVAACPLCGDMRSFARLLRQCGVMLHGRRGFMSGRDFSHVMTQLMLAGPHTCTLTASQCLMHIMQQMVEAQPLSPMPWSDASIAPLWKGEAFAADTVTGLLCGANVAHLLAKMTVSEALLRHNLPLTSVEVSGSFCSLLPDERLKKCVAVGTSDAAATGDSTVWDASGMHRACVRLRFRRFYDPGAASAVKLQAKVEFVSEDGAVISNPTMTLETLVCRFKVAHIGTKVLGQLSKGRDAARESPVMVKPDSVVETSLKKLSSDWQTVTSVGFGSATHVKWQTEDDCMVYALFVEFGCEGRPARVVDGKELLPLLSVA